MKLVINRLDHTETQTLGSLLLYNGPLLIFSCYTLELPDKNNERNISRIPAGTYKGKRRWSDKYLNHIHILDVPDRDLILIHNGNYYTQTEGCALVGTGLYDINEDGEKDVTNSKTALKTLMSLVPQYFDIIIHDL